VSKAPKKHPIEMPSVAEDRKINAAAKADPDAQPLLPSQLKAMVPLRAAKAHPSGLRDRQVFHVNANKGKTIRPTTVSAAASGLLGAVTPLLVPASWLQPIFWAALLGLLVLTILASVNTADGRAWAQVLLFPLKAAGVWPSASVPSATTARGGMLLTGLAFWVSFSVSLAVMQ
jgi:hypothetical protein